MKRIIHISQSDTVVKLGLVLSIVTFVAGIVLLGIFWMQLPDYLSLYPKLPWGYARIGAKLELLYPCIVMFGFFAGTFSFLPSIYERAMLLGRFLVVTLGISNFFFLIFIFQTIRII